MDPEELTYLSRTRREMDRIFSLQEPDAIEAFFSKVTPFEMLACSIRWHEQGESYSAQKQALGISNLGDLDNWAALSEPTKTPQGCWVKPLTSKADLNEEGKAMGHCVGWNGYDAKCLTKNDHIVSVSEDGADKRLSTIQLREVFNKAGQVVDLEIVQNQGPGKEKGEQAVKWYIKELFRNKAMKPDWEEIEAIRSDNRNIAMKEGIVQKIGFDPLIAENRERAYESIRPFLPARYRQVGLDEFLASSSSAEALQIENTEFGQALAEHNIIRLKKTPEAQAEEHDVTENENKPLFLRILGL